MMLKKIAKYALLSALLGLIALMTYGWHLSGQVEKRFSARRWSIPSTVYSDTTLLYPGQHINPQQFREKLLNIGYRGVKTTPSQKGEIRIRTDTLDIYLNDLKTPWTERPGFLAQIGLSDDRIGTIRRKDNGQMIAILELEPEEIMQFFGHERERRQLISIDQVPEHQIQAVLAAEDHRFFQHSGVDWRGILRAVMTNLRHGTIRQGGSTLTQQLAKNYFLTPVRTFTRKLKELILALIIEFKYDKREILEIYLNEIYLGQKGSVAINGIGEASYFYFGKPVERLTLSEAAVMAGLIKAPNNYSPYRDMARCRDRRDTVLEAMHRWEWITQAELEDARKQPIKTVGFMAAEKKAPYFIDYLTEQLNTLYRPKDLTSLGLSIYTTLDTQVQMAAEDALAKGLAHLENSNPQLQRAGPEDNLQGALVVMQPATGHILALVGGRNYSVSQFNRITQARRQPGSAFKPFVYLSALNKFTPTTLLSNDRKSYTVNGKQWHPQNFEPVTEYTVSLRDALKKSYNLATVDLAMKTGLNRIVELAAKFNFSTPIKPYPSLALGAFEVIPLELARAYCVFAAEGVQPFPLSLKGVSDENNRILEQQHLDIERLITPAEAFVMTNMLQGVVKEGTARSLQWRGVTWPVAGKTGTTNDFRDAWFVGYTPDILALVWVGFDNGDSIQATGAAAALPIWADLMKAIPQYRSETDFKIPQGVEKILVCPVTGRPAVAGCPDPVEVYFLTAHVPDGECPLHAKDGIAGKIIKGIKGLINDE
ncbi:MAG: PBP1A family penicillin-binding protein [Desulfobacterales bacterium]|jgi:penicillin-binding protein 1B